MAGLPLKGSLGRFAIPMPEIAKSDPFWLKEDPHRTAHTQQAVFGPTLPIYEAYNPAIAQVNAEHVFSIAEFDVMKEGMSGDPPPGSNFATLRALGPSVDRGRPAFGETPTPFAAAGTTGWPPVDVVTVTRIQ